LIGAPPELRQKANEKGMLTLRMSGWKDQDGDDSIEEVRGNLQDVRREHGIAAAATFEDQVEQGGSDLHITTNSPPQVRVDGVLKALNMPPLTPTETKQLCYSILTDNQKHRLEEDLEIDFSFGIKGSPARANVFAAAVAGAFRRIPYEIWCLKSWACRPSFR
jgi:hypothetical protein